MLVCKLSPRFANIITYQSIFFITLLSFLLLSACARQSVSYTRVQHTYEQIPLSRSARLSTYTVDLTEVPFKPNITIPGMRLESTNPDMRIALKFISATPTYSLSSLDSQLIVRHDNLVVAEPNNPVLVVTRPNSPLAQRIGTSAALVDLRPSYERHLEISLHEEYANPVVIRAWKLRDAPVESWLHITASQTVDGKVLLKDVLHKVQHIQLGSLKPAADSRYSDIYDLSSLAHRVIRGRGCNAHIVRGKVVVAKADEMVRDVNAEKSMAAQNLLTDAEKQANDAQKMQERVLGEQLQKFLEYHFASGTKVLECEFALVEDDPRWLSLQQRFVNFAKGPDPVTADSLIGDINALVAGQNAQTRLQAAAAYNRSLCHLFVGRLDAAIQTLGEAMRINAQEKDSIFDNSGQELNKRIAHLRVHLEDCAARHAAARARGELK